MQIKDRTFIISGGASGLGLATATDLHAHGASIAILDINEENGAAAVKILGPARTKFFSYDASASENTPAVVEAVKSWIGSTGKPLAGIIPAAGTGMPGKLIDRKNKPIDLEKLTFVLDINLRGTLDLIRCALPMLAANTPSGPDGERGVIIMVSSSAAFDGQPGQVAYAASKGAIRSLTLPLARDLAPLGIRAVSIAPSYFESAMTAQMSDKVKKSLEGVFEWPKRPGRGVEFAGCVRFVVENVMVNGECLRLDGATRMPSRM